VDFPIKNGGSFHSYENVYQRVGRYRGFVAMPELVGTLGFRRIVARLEQYEQMNAIPAYKKMAKIMKDTMKQARNIPKHMQKTSKKSKSRWDCLKNVGKTIRKLDG